ncbi:MAG: hypothetical protein M3Y08_20410 [Fibrobacterota bacterium]|nr:hypothetical protein [Fibrobacterota bacterium]
MKNQLLTAILLLVGSVFASPWTDGGAGITTPGSVGIGLTTTPTFGLEVNGTVGIKSQSTATNAYTTFRIQGPNFTHGIEMDFFGNNAFTGSDYGAGKGGAALMNVNALPFLFGTANVPRLWIHGDGKVGIGSTSAFLPRSPLDVVFNGAVFNEDKSIAHFTHKTPTGRTVDLTVDYRGSTIGDGTLVLREDRAAKDFMLVNMLATPIGNRVVFPNGDIGIGGPTKGVTPFPDARLSIQSDGGQGTGEAGVYPTKPLAHIVTWADDGPATDNDVAVFRVSAGRINTTDPRAGNAKLFEVGADDIRLFTVRANGKIGIGNPNPTEKLDVAGTIKANSIKVAKFEVVPDYVFEKGYQLASLEKVESFVQKNKHLPEIPSAKEMHRQGMDLADMNLRLLKKVEELTLYSIAQAKDIKALRAEVRAIQGKAKR